MPSSPNITPESPEDGADQETDILCKREEWAIEVQLLYCWAQDETAK